MDLSTLIACLLLVTVVLAINRLLENRTTQIVVHSCTSFCDMAPEGEADEDSVVIIDEEGEEGEGEDLAAAAVAASAAAAAQAQAHVQATPEKDEKKEQ